MSNSFITLRMIIRHCIHIAGLYRKDFSDKAVSGQMEIALNVMDRILPMSDFSEWFLNRQSMALCANGVVSAQPHFMPEDEEEYDGIFCCAAWGNNTVKIFLEYMPLPVAKMA